MRLKAIDSAGRASSGRHSHRAHTPSALAGFALVEVLVSVVFLSIAFLTLVTLIAAGRITVKKAYYTVRAASATGNVLDGCRGDGYDGSSGASDYVTSDLPEGNAIHGEISGYACVTNSTGLKMVTVTATWPGGDDANYAGGNVTFQTLLADRSSEAAYRLKRGY